jgi:hypothetical protein
MEVPHQASYLLSRSSRFTRAHGTWPGSAVNRSSASLNTSTIFAVLKPSEWNKAMEGALAVPMRAMRCLGSRGRVDVA